MTIEVRAGSLLADGPGTTRLQADWLSGKGGVSPSAAAEIRRALEAPSGSTCPLFRAGVIPSGQGAPAPRTVVTGQQPGFLGGPLYTLFKIATAVALAARLSRGGVRAVPVFWSGDDDSDLNEALSSLGWDPAERRLFASEGVALARSPRFRNRTVGSLESRSFSAGAARWLHQRAGAGGDPLVADLAALWARAVAEDWPWSRLAAAAWSACFAGTDLLVVSGDDPALHAAGQDVVARWRTLDDAGEPVRARGQELTAEGYHAQLDERSLRHPWYVVENGRRRILDPGATGPVEGRVRPGVLFRSPLQDLLLEPAAVVVGPGEHAYLRQLEPLYRRLGVPRAPLVPRLGGWLLPEQAAYGQLERWLAAAAGREAACAEWTDAWVRRNASELAGFLTGTLGVDAPRAKSLAEGRTRRWRRGLAAMLAAEDRRRIRDDHAGAPPWVLPHGLRQERKLASIAAVGLFGSPLLEAVRNAAEQHLDRGLAGEWREFHFGVPEPAKDG
ncbi:bacillithiol biosynthesis BshC [bacterium]|nr:bacillithiol biosynthesis BshC [bacterium]